MGGLTGIVKDDHAARQRGHFHGGDAGELLQQSLHPLGRGRIAFQIGELDAQPSRHVVAVTAHGAQPSFPVRFKKVRQLG